MGSWLKAKITTSHEDYKNKKRIELTIEPESVNENLEVDDLIVNNILQCSVKSIEDHGIILDTGKQEYSGFISNKELTNAQIDVNTIVPGLVILCSIASKPSGRTINLKPTTATISQENHSFNNFINRFYIQPG